MAIDDRHARTIGRTAAMCLLWVALLACEPARAAAPEAIDLTVTTSDGRFSDLVAPDGAVVERILGTVDVKQVVRRIDERPR
jgi:Mg-chelatase subunit ChlI